MFTFRGRIDDGTLPPRPAGSDAGDVNQLRADVERLYFIAEALWRILREKLGVDDQEIIRQIAAIDLEDGKLDGRKAPQPPQPCPKCGRILTKQRINCMYCGEFIAADPFDR
jgi:hypothetical protein